MSAAPAPAGAEPLGADEFARLMADLGPFEAAPRVAVAVSGGRDSLALALLASAWAAARGGSAVALTVDHGLRPEAAAEAARVAGWLVARGIAHRVLPWRGAKPANGLQAAARAARYGLLTGWCRRQGIAHLLLGHQRDDQAETFLMRLARGSGLEGLAAMPARRRQDGARLLRPLLTVPRARLEATLRHLGQAWIDDPSNADPAYERTRVGERAERLSAAGLDRGRLAAAAAEAGRGRAALERALAALSAESASLSPAGFALLRPQALAAAPADVRRALFRRLLLAVGGGDYAPSGAQAERFDRAFLAAGAEMRRSLGGCVVAPWRGRLLVVREARRPPPPAPLTAVGEVCWDRFRCRLRPGAAGGPFSVGMLGREGWRRWSAALPGGWPPAPARAMLPALREAGGAVLAVGLGHVSVGPEAARFSARFRPPQALAPDAFAVASRPLAII